MKTSKSDSTRLLVVALVGVMSIFGATYTLLLNRMDKQEIHAAADIAALREEIKTTKIDAKDAVNAAAVASKDAVAATAVALKDSVTATALASKDAVAASAAALKDSVTATAASSKDAVSAISKSLSDKIDVMSLRIDRLEEHRDKPAVCHALEPDK